MNAEERKAFSADAHCPAWVRAWDALYAGKLVADDIEALAKQLAGAEREPQDAFPECFRLRASDDLSNRLLGNHADIRTRLPPALRVALDRALRESNGSGIWRAPVNAVVADAYETLVRARDEPLDQWRRRTLALLREHLAPDPHSRALRDVPRDYRIPVLSPGDRRAFLRARWSPFLPEALWHAATPTREGSAQVYLDVSGSMSAEMPLVIALVATVARWIRRPLWAFSDDVVPATIERGMLKASTTGGTSMRCVLEHVAKTRPAAAIVLTDGYTERLDAGTVRDALAATRLTALVTRDGSPAELRRAGIAYRQLDEVPS